MAVVEARDLRKSFGKTRALDGVSLDIAAGEVLGVLGPNGAGKTTAVRVLTTLLRPDGGTARIDGIDVLAEPERVRSRIGLTGQYAALDERLTARENLELVGRFFRQSRSQAAARAAELLDQLRLNDAADREVRTFSGGMRRRIDIAMSLVARPRVLFLDEPTTGLDPVSRQDMWGLIEELVAAGATTLLTTQYLEEADVLANRISVVDHGRVIAEGTSRELKARLGGHTAEITFADAADAERAERELAPDALGVTVPLRTGPQLVVQVPVAITAPALVRRLDGLGINPVEVIITQPTLDDVFFALTGSPVHDAPNESAVELNAEGAR